MSLTITIDSVDVTDKVRLDSIALDMQAIQGQVGAGNIVIDDTTGTADLAPATKKWLATESTATPTTIAGGYIAERSPDKGPLVAGTQRQWSPVLEDHNTVLTDRVLRSATAKRPAETDYQRVNWLIGMSGLAMLDGAGQIPNTNTVDMDKTNYRGKTPLDVLDDAAEAAGKNFYVYWKQGTGWVLYYDKTGSSTAAFTSSLRISDDPTDIDDAVTFGPSAVDYTLDPQRIYSGMYVRWASGWVWKVKAATQTAYRQLHRTVIKRNMKKSKTARKWAVRQLDKLNEETKRLGLTVSVPGSALGELRAGMRIQVKLRARGVTAFTYFRITGATIRPRQGGQGFSDVEYDVRLSIRDKIRPVNLDDDFGGGDGGDGGGGSGGDGGDGGGSGSGIDTSEYVLDDFDRTSSTGTGYPDVFDSQPNVSASPQTSHSVLLPNGPDVTGRMVVIFGTNTSTASEFHDDLVSTHGFTSAAFVAGPGSNASWVVYRIIDGTESWAATGQTLAVTTTLNQEYSIMGYVLTDAIELEASSDASIANPPELDPTWIEASSARWYTFGIAVSSISGDPTGYATDAGGFLGSAAYWRVSTKTDDSLTEDPTGYTYTGAAVAFTVAIRSALTAGSAWGTILLGEGVDTEAPWEGGNIWTTEVVTGSAVAATDGTDGTIVVSADGTEVIEKLRSETPGDTTEEPSGPWSMPASYLVRFKALYLGDVTDAAANMLQFQTFDDTSRPGVRIHLGDAVATSYSSSGLRGLVLLSGSTFGTFVAKTLLADTYYLLRFDARGATLRARLWLASDPEPVAWDTTLARVDEPGLADVSWLYVQFYGNVSPGNMKLSVDYIKAQLGSDGLTTTFLPPGDGSSTVWYIEEWVGTLKVWVDGVLTEPASFDRSAGTFTLGSAPALAAVIRVEYMPA